MWSSLVCSITLQGHSELFETILKGASDEGCCTEQLPHAAIHLGPVVQN